MRRWFKEERFTICLVLALGVWLGEVQGPSAASAQSERVVPNPVPIPLPLTQYSPNQTTQNSPNPSEVPALPLEQPCQDHPKPFSATLTLTQDSFFGFYPILNGYYDLTERLQFSFYGQFWTTPSFSTTGAGGSGLWTEIGLGVNYKLPALGLAINPQIGVLNGVLLSGADRPRAFEGIVPTLTINYSTTYLEGQLYAGYYLATAAPRNNDFLHWWVNGGVKPWAEAHHAASLLSIGFHFEQLYQTRNRLGDTGNLYTWLGPYLQFKWTNGIYLRFNAGWDLQNNLSNNFYKATMGFSF